MIPLSRVRLNPKKVGYMGRHKKNADFWAKNAVFLDQNHFFREIIQNFCYHHDCRPKRQRFCVDPVARRAGRRGPFLAQNSAFFYAKPMKPPFFSRPTDPTH